MSLTLKLSSICNSTCVAAANYQLTFAQKLPDSTSFPVEKKKSGLVDSRVCQ